MKASLTSRAALAITVIMFLGLNLVGINAAGAQSADSIAANLNDNGVFVGEGADGSTADFEAVVSQLTSEGFDLRIVSLGTEPNNPEAVVDDLRDLTSATVLLITPQSLFASSPVYSTDAINEALDGSDFSNLADGALTFGRTLGDISSSSPATTTADATTADTISADDIPAGSSTASTTETSSSGGGGSGFLIFLLVVGGGILALVLFVRAKNKKRLAVEISARRETVHNELAEIGADIVELSDRVTVADQTDSTNHYRLGNEQYLELQAQLEAAKSLWEVTQVDYAADTAAWHLDAAEALLDGEPVPDEPERPDLTVSRPPEEREVERERSRADDRGRVDSRLDEQTQDDRGDRDHGGRRVEPRRRRRDDWEAPKTRGGGFGDIVTGILVGGALNGGGYGRRRAPRRYNGGGSLGGLGSISRGGGSGSRSRGGSGSRSRGGSGRRSR